MASKGFSVVLSLFMVVSVGEVQGPVNSRVIWLPSSLALSCSLSDILLLG